MEKTIYKKLQGKSKSKLVLQGVSLNGKYYVYKPANEALSNFRYVIPLVKDHNGGWINLFSKHKYHWQSYNTNITDITY